MPENVLINNASVAVTGTFWQTTQPVSGTFWQATQPVSGTFWQSTQPVSGTFWQATQPVSIASMPSTPVTGTFWQATQPVSAASLPLPTGAATDATLTTIDTDLKTVQPRKVQATLSDNDAAYTAAAISDLLQTSTGRLKVDAGNDYQRRLDEINYLQNFATVVNTIIASESENSQRGGFEIR